MIRKIIPNSQSAIRNLQSAIRSGSAIILAVVLTTLLAILGVLFLFSSRVDSVATSAVGDNHDLKLAVDTVVARISEVLTNNVPGVDPNAYYNYPDDNNPWLASLEPNDANLWPHITDLYYQFGPLAYDLSPVIIHEHSDTAGNSTPTFWFNADADGDGVSDSMWVQVQDVNSSKGKPIYAAIRIIDNGGMLNINTGYKFDPSTSVGSTQLDINLMALSWRPNNPLFPYNPAAESVLLLTRNPYGLPNYENDVIWQYGLPNGAYTPFDISDELELRYRFLVNQTGIDTRSETMTGWQIGRQYDFRAPTSNIVEWLKSSISDYVLTDPNYEYRHIATTYNMDRIINPAGGKMFNINSPLTFDINSIYNAVRAALDPCVFTNGNVAQITANLMDYIDGPSYPSNDPRYDPNNTVTVVPDPCNPGNLYYGFEQPCIYISQIAENSNQPDPRDPTVYHSYAIELFKPYTSDPLPDANWQLVVGGNSPVSISWLTNSSFLVIRYLDPTGNAPLDINNVNAVPVDNVPGIVFGAGDNILLQRIVNGFPLTVDSLVVPAADSTTGWLVPIDNNSSPHSIKRDIILNKCIRRLWESPSSGSLLPPDLGSFSGRYLSPDPYMIQAHPANKQFTNIGEIGQLFRTDANMIGPGDTEASVRLNIADPCVQNLFNYLTVMDPNIYTNETRIKGRININTAPWFVLAQLPWVSYQNYNLAQAIVNYRNTYGPFKNIGQLINVGILNSDPNSLNRVDYYAQTPGSVFPALTPTDGTNDYFELRDAIFTRISNLITVRSDVFTAYILVRIGSNGPQKRVIAIFDRSGVTPAGGKVKIVAIQQVPDPR